MKALLAINPPRDCDTCGCLSWMKYTYEYEPGGSYGTKWISYCTKKVGDWCQYYNRYLKPGETGIPW